MRGEGRREGPVAAARGVPLGKRFLGVGQRQNGRRDAGRDAGAGKSNAVRVAVVAPQVLGGEAPGSLLRVQHAGPRRAPVRQGQVEVTVQVVVAERRREGLPGAHGFDTGVPGHVREGAVAVVAEQAGRVALQAADEQIEVAVAIDVGEGRPGVAVVAGRRAGEGEPGRCRHLGEPQAAVVAIQEVGADVTAHDEQVDVAVVVVVAGRGAGAGHQVDEREAVDAAHAALESNARLRRGVAKARGRLVRGARHGCGGGQDGRQQHVDAGPTRECRRWPAAEGGRRPETAAYGAASGPAGLPMSLSQSDRLRAARGETPAA